MSKPGGQLAASHIYSPFDPTSRPRKSSQHPARRLRQQTPGSIEFNGIKSAIQLPRNYDTPKHEQTHAVSTWAVGSVDSNPCPIVITCLLPRSATHPHPSSAMSSNKYAVFESRSPMEEEWTACEELFNAHGYKFRPRLRKGWTPSWFTSGKSPLYSEDSELLKVR